MSDSLHLCLPVSARKSSAHMKQIPRNRCNCSLIENCRFPPLRLGSFEQPRTLARLSVWSAATRHAGRTQRQTDPSMRRQSGNFLHQATGNARQLSCETSDRPSVRNGLDLFTLLTNVQLRTGLYVVKIVKGSKLQLQCPVWDCLRLEGVTLCMMQFSGMWAA